MGRIKTKLVKRATKKLYDRYSQEFKPSFEENKQLVQKHADIPSKKLKNVIAGYLTRLVKQKEEV